MADVVIDMPVRMSRAYLNVSNMSHTKRSSRSSKAAWRSPARTGGQHQPAAERNRHATIARWSRSVS